MSSLAISDVAATTTCRTCGETVVIALLPAEATTSLDRRLPYAGRSAAAGSPLRDVEQLCA